MEEKNDYKLNLDWSAVEEALSDNSPTGFKMAVLETDKVFHKFIAKFNYLGSEPQKKIKNLAHFLKKEKELKLLEMVKKKLLQEKFDLSREDTKEIISEYWQIIKLSDEFDRRTRRIKKIWLKLKNSFLFSLLNISAISFIILILAIKFFSATKIGNEIIAGIIKVADFLFLKILIAIGLIIIFFIAIQIKKYLSKK